MTVKSNNTNSPDSAVVDHAEIIPTFGPTATVNSTTSSTLTLEDFTNSFAKESATQLPHVSPAKAMRLEGNSAFRLPNFPVALEKYSEAICLFESSKTLTERMDDPEAFSFYSNRALCHIKLENYGAAVEDANQALMYRPNFTKAIYHRGCARFCLTKYQVALKDFTEVHKLARDAVAASRIRECVKLIKEKRFASAICSGRLDSPVSTTFDLNSIPVPQDYKGPVYESGNCTSAFLSSLIEYIRVPGNVLPMHYAGQLLLDIINILKKFYDLLNIFKLNGLPSETTPYLFNGDFIDRGAFSIECIMTLLTAKVIFPEHVHLARGNHETVNMNSLYGFKGEVVAKYDERMYHLFCECFRWLPLAHLINEKIFVVHGGLFSQDGVTLADIESINRNCEPADDGLMTELLWSDPQSTYGRAPSFRGVACRFGPNVTESFLQENNLSLVIRSHEVKDQGYEVEHDKKLITVFSAPNYCDCMGNKGAFIRLNGKDLQPNFVQFSAVEHPAGCAMKYVNALLQA
ncbi:serine/threonine protein phosphatase, partial [Cardiosporidium cionae]